MRDLRVRWLLGADEARTRRGAQGLALVVGVCVLGALASGPAPHPLLLIWLLALPAIAGVAYALANGGPLLALLAAQGVVLVQGARGLAGASSMPGAYELVALPAALAAFALGAVRAHALLGGPPALGVGRKAPAAMLLLWFAAVVLLAWALTLPEPRLGPQVAGHPSWVLWLRSVTLWGPAGVALGWAVVRRGPALAFLLATTNVWAWYLARWLRPAAPEGPLWLGELLLPAAVDPARGLATFALAAGAMVAALAFEPAWPWMAYRKEQPGEGSHQV